jgi:glycerol-3-phosphate O-acyltransferase
VGEADEALPPNSGSCPWSGRGAHGAAAPGVLRAGDIGYERIVETGAYERELSGGEKVRKTPRVSPTTDVLRHRYGRINLQFGSTLTLGDIREDSVR